MPRRVAIYPHDPQWQTLNQISTLGAILIGISTIVFVVNVAVSWKKHPAGDNPWDAHTLEWFTTSPPPHHNYYRLPQSAQSAQRGTTTTPITRPRGTATIRNRNQMK